MAEQTVRGIIVGGVNFGESDKMVHLLTDLGQRTLSAPRARLSKKRFGGGLIPFNTIDAEIAQTSRDIPTLSSVSVVVSRFRLTSSLEKLSMASYVSELAWKVVQEGLQSDILSLLETCLDELLRDEHLAIVRAFELRLLDELGHRPYLDRCVRCGNEGEFLDLFEGGLFCASHKTQDSKQVGPNTLKWMRICLDSSTKVHLCSFSSSDAERIARILQRPLERCFERLVGRPMKSLSLLKKTLDS